MLHSLYLLCYKHHQSSEGIALNTFGKSVMKKHSMDVAMTASLCCASANQQRGCGEVWLSYCKGARFH